MTVFDAKTPSGVREGDYSEWLVWAQAQLNKPEPDVAAHGVGHTSK